MHIPIRIPLAAVRTEKIGGVESATYNLCRSLAPASDLRVTVTDTARLSPDFLSWLNYSGDKVQISKQIRVSDSKIFTRFFEEFIHSAYERRDEYIIYPNYFLPPAVKKTQCRAVVIHDCQHRVYPMFYSRAKRRWLDLCYNNALRRADKVFAISEYEKCQLIKFFGSEYKSKIHVCGNAIDLDRLRGGGGSSNFNIPFENYILSVAHHFPHKNVDTLIMAFAEIAKHDTGLALILVGSASAQIKILVASLNESVSSRIYLAGFVSDTELGQLYKFATLFVAPSLYEGFGMPAVEAVALGVPTLISDASALPEVTRGRVRKVPHKSESWEWANAIKEAIAYPQSADERASAALEIQRVHCPAAVADRVISALGAME